MKQILNVVLVIDYKRLAVRMARLDLACDQVEATANLLHYSECVQSL